MRTGLVRRWGVLGAAVVASALGGCVIVDESCDHPPTPPVGDCPNVRAARSISFSSDRAEALKRIASMPGLAEPEQYCVIDASTDRSLFSSDATEVLVAIASNPALTPGARTHLSDRLPRAGLFSSDSKKVVDAMLNNPGAGGPPAPGPIPVVMPGDRPFGEPMDLRLTAERSGEWVTLRARGSNPTGGYTTYLAQAPMKILPPQFVLVNSPPEGPATQVVSVFEAGAQFRLEDRWPDLVVHLGDRKVKVPIVGR